MKIFKDWYYKISSVLYFLFDRYVGCGKYWLFRIYVWVKFGWGDVSNFFSGVWFINLESGGNVDEIWLVIKKFRIFVFFI